MKLPPSDEVRVQMLMEERPDFWTRERAVAFVRNTPHTYLPIETRVVE
jgi:hypothetical protein